MIPHLLEVGARNSFDPCPARLRQEVKRGEQWPLHRDRKIEMQPPPPVFLKHPSVHAGSKEGMSCKEKNFSGVAVVRLQVRDYTTTVEPSRSSAAVDRVPGGTGDTPTSVPRH